MTFIAVCSCGQGVAGEDRGELAGKVAAHLTGRFFPAEPAGGDHVALIGKADARLIADVKMEALDDPHA